MSGKDAATVEAPAGVTVQIAPTPRPRAVKQPEQLEQKRDEQESKVAQLIDSLGGNGGKLKIWRVMPDGTQKWVKQIDVDDAILENLEDSLAALLGGGKFYVRGWHKNAYVGAGVTLAIDEELYPSTTTKKDEPAKPPVDNQTALFVALEQMRREQAAEQQRVQAELQKAQQQQMALLIAVMQDSQRSTVELARAFAGGAHQQRPADDGLGQVSKVAQFLQTMGWAPSGAAAAPDTSMTERVLGMVVTPIASKFAETFAAKVVEGNAPPTPSQRPQLPPAQAPAAEVKRELLEKPVDKREIKLPPGARVFKPGDVARAAPGARTAPPVAQAMPQQAAKK